MHMGDLELEAKIDELLKMAKALDPPVQRIGVVDPENANSVYLLPAEDICFVTTLKEGKKSGIEFYASDGKTYVGFSSLSDLVKKVADDPKFMQVHKSFVVNLKQVVTIKMATGGRDLICQAWPNEVVRCSQDYVKDLEDYFKI
jgi:DNA-binding LytR/AlgR family response regulator